MPIPAPPLRLGSSGPEVAQLHRTLEHLKHKIEQGERAARRFGPSTKAVLEELQAQTSLLVTGDFDDATRAVIERTFSENAPGTVFGRLCDADGMPIADATVQVFSVRLRSEEEVGCSVTDAWGEYEI